MKILITGVNGMLGSALATGFSKSVSTKVYGTGRNPICRANNIEQYFSGDLTDTDFVDELKLSVEPDVIIHCAALVNLKECEDHPEMARDIHISATQSLSETFGTSRFFYISTDSVFDGERGDYSEKDDVNPLNTYALTKFEGEQVIRTSHREYLILRTNIFGNNSPSGSSLFEWAYKSLSESKEITGFDNFIFNPLYVGQISDIIERLLLDFPDLVGTFHVGSDRHISKYKFLCMVADHFSFDHKLIAKRNGNANAGGVARPENTSLNTDKIREYLANHNFDIESGFGMLKDETHKTPGS